MVQGFFCEMTGTKLGFAVHQYRYARAEAFHQIWIGIDIDNIQAVAAEPAVPARKLRLKFIT